MSDDYDCVAVAIITHGSENDYIYGVGKTNDLRPLNDILEPLKDIKKGIPKLVFIQVGDRCINEAVLLTVLLLILHQSSL